MLGSASLIASTAEGSRQRWALAQFRDPALLAALCIAITDYRVKVT
jgi:hypothetical protein